MLVGLWSGRMLTDPTMFIRMAKWVAAFSIHPIHFGDYASISLTLRLVKGLK
jgi:hypothetical protein